MSLSDGLKKAGIWHRERTGDVPILNNLIFHTEIDF